MKDQETKERFVVLRGKGWSYEKIARVLNTSKQTLINWSKEFSVEFSNIRQIRLESIAEQFGLLKEQRIAAYGENLKKVIEELRKRDLKDVSTDRLFDISVKYQAVIQREIVEPVFREEANNLFKLEDIFTSVNSWKP